MGDEYEQLGPAGNVPPPPGAIPPPPPPPPPPRPEEEGDRGYEFAGIPSPSPFPKQRGSHEKKTPRKGPSFERKRGSDKGRKKRSTVTPRRSSSSSEPREIPVSVYMALQEKSSFSICGCLSCLFIFVVIAGIMAFLVYAFVLDGFAEKDGSDNSTTSSPFDGAPIFNGDASPTTPDENPEHIK